MAGVSGGDWVCFGVWVAHCAYSCAVTKAELPAQCPGAASVPETLQEEEAVPAGAQLQFF